MSTAIPRRAIHLVGLKRTLGRVSTWLLLGALPALLVFAPLVVGFHNGTGAWALDFNGNFVIPARDILRGVSPYHPRYLEHVRAAVAHGRRPDQFSKGVFATYPAPALLIGVPFTYLPRRWPSGSGWERWSPAQPRRCASRAHATGASTARRC